jgi:hypothetical protein
VEAFEKRHIQPFPMSSPLRSGHRLILFFSLVI